MTFFYKLKKTKINTKGNNNIMATVYAMVQGILPYIIILAGIIIITKFKSEIQLLTKTVYKSRYKKSFFARKRSIWHKRIITTLVITSMFLTFGVQTNNAVIQERLNVGLTNKVTYSGQLDNGQFYQALQVELMTEIAPNIDQYVTSIEDAEAFAAMMVDLGTMDSSVDIYDYNKTSETYISIIKYLTEYVLSQREENKTLFFNTLSKTIFAASVFDKLQILDMGLLQIKDIYGINNQTTIKNLQTQNITLKQLFSNSIREVIADNPPSLTPNNDKYEPSLSYALQMGLITFEDLGLPAKA